MSIALDFAMFMRNSKTKLNLSIAARWVANVLAFRIGSNTTTWIGQETLASELGIIENSVRLHCKALAKAGLIKIEKQKKDKRRNVYNFTDIILNYHAMNDAQKKKCHLKLSDTFRDTPYLEGVNTPQNQVVSSCETPIQVIENNKEKQTAQIPKVTIESNTKSKDKVICASESDARASDDDFELFWSIYPKKKDKARARDRFKKLPKNQVPIILAKLREQVLSDVQWKNQQYIPHASTYLQGKRWEDEITLQRDNKSPIQNILSECFDAARRTIQ